MIRENKDNVNNKLTFDKKKFFDYYLRESNICIVLQDKTEGRKT